MAMLVGCHAFFEVLFQARTWDAMNKANQGGIAIFGAQVVAAAGYRGCFVGTFIILFIRTLLKENYP